NNSPVVSKFIGAIPKWYKHLATTATASPNSLRINDRYKVSNIVTDSLVSLTGFTMQDDFSLMTPINPSNLSHWCCSWDSITNTPIYGRAWRSSKTKVYIQHWIPVVSSSSLLTPQSQPLSLQACSGCHFHDLSLFNRKNPCKKLSSLPCVFTELHSNVLDLKK